MSRRGSKSLPFNSSDEDEKESLRSSKMRNRTNSSSSSSDKSRNSNSKKDSLAKIHSRSLSLLTKSSDESSSDESFKKKPQSSPQSNMIKTKQDSDSDSDSGSGSDTTIKKSIKSSHDSFERPRNSRTSERKKPILKTSSSSRSRSNSPANYHKKVDSDSDADSRTLGSSISKIKIKSKPPIDKHRLSRKTSSRQSYFEKPDSDSESDTKISNASKNSKTLTENTDGDSQEPNEMTDVSSLASPRETKIKIKSDKFDEDEDARRGRSAFYGALHQKTHTRPNSVNFNFSHNYTNSADFSEKIYGRELMRIEAQQRRMFNEFLQENEGKSRKIDRPFRITSSAINRQREQQRIEKENQLILKRLLSVKSSKDVRRDNQLKDYEKNMGRSDLNLSRNSVKSGLSTKRSQKSSVCHSRVSSAKSINRSGQTPLDYSNRTLSIARKPEWSNRW